MVMMQPTSFDSLDSYQMGTPEILLILLGLAIVLLIGRLIMVHKPCGSVTAQRRAKALPASSLKPLVGTTCWSLSPPPLSNPPPTPYGEGFRMTLTADSSGNVNGGCFSHTDPTQPINYGIVSSSGTGATCSGAGTLTVLNNTTIGNAANPATPPFGQMSYDGKGHLISSQGETLYQWPSC